MAFAGRGQAPGLMLLPNAIVIDSKNTIYVADFAAGLVDVYQLINTSAQDSFAPEPGRARLSARRPLPLAPATGHGRAPSRTQREKPHDWVMIPRPDGPGPLIQAVNG